MSKKIRDTVEGRSKDNINVSILTEKEIDCLMNMENKFCTCSICLKSRSYD